MGRVILWRKTLSLRYVRRLRAYLVRYRRELSAASMGLAVLSIVTQLHPLSSHQVWVASHHITAGRVLTAGDVRAADSLITWPSLITARSQIVGRPAARDLDAGEPLTRQSVLAPATLSGSGRVAVTMEVSAGDAHLVRSGDRIDVLASDGDQAARVVAATAGVVSVLSQNVVVVAVLPSEALTMAGFRSSGTFSVVLLSDR